MVGRKCYGLFLFFIGLLSLTLSCGGAATNDPPPTPTPVSTPVPSPSPTPTVTPTPTPTQTGTVQHVIVVVMQNSSFDHLFGAFSPPSGSTVEGLRPGVPGYTQKDANGKTVSPHVLTQLAPAALPEGRAKYTEAMNGGLMDKYASVEGDLSMGYYDGSASGMSTLWGYAQQYAISDNYFASVIGEAPSNQLYMIAASDDEFPYSFQPTYGPCEKPDNASRPLTFTNVGDQLTAAGIPWAVYQESLSDCTQMSALHNPFQYFTSTQNSTQMRDYSTFTTDLSGGTFPAVSFVVPNQAHDLHPGYTPITEGIAFLDDLIKQVQASNVWSSTVILITFDDAGGWYDHVPPPVVDTQGLAGRVPLLVISPLTKQGHVSHVQLDHVSILRFIQKNWGLASLNSRNDLSNDLSDFFQ